MPLPARSPGSVNHQLLSVMLPAEAPGPEGSAARPAAEEMDGRELRCHPALHQHGTQL